MSSVHLTRSQTLKQGKKRLGAPKWLVGYLCEHRLDQLLELVLILTIINSGWPQSTVRKLLGTRRGRNLEIPRRWIGELLGRLLVPCIASRRAVCIRMTRAFARQTFGSREPRRPNRNRIGLLVFDACKYFTTYTPHSPAACTNQCRRLTIRPSPFLSHTDSRDFSSAGVRLMPRSLMATLSS